MEDFFISAKNGIAMIWTGWISVLVWALGGFDLSVKVLVFLMLADYVTGIWAGYITKTVNSTRAYKGISKKVFILIIVSCSTVIEQLVPNVGIRNLVIVFYVATEFLSVIENASKLGLPIPEKLKIALEQCKGDKCNSKCSDVKNIKPGKINQDDFDNIK
ncbi:phage holin family protein [Fusobacterium massiliense]|uniref:phage holin family protein n=1 Tax=Fusobacterium massiliense TaxID=1852365 RepID=UPI0028D09169|nr:phage holin family protein [Fusobacterium massiliense]